MRVCHRNFRVIHSAVIIFPEPADPRAAHNYMAIYVTVSIVKCGALLLLSTARENCQRCFFRGKILYDAHVTPAVRIC